MRSDDEVVASRVFERDDGAVRLSFCKPVPYPNPEFDADPQNSPWRCNFNIDFPDGETKYSYSVGVDSIQALLLVFAGAQNLLFHVGDGTPRRRPPIRWHGSEDLGLSITHFSASDAN